MRKIFLILAFLSALIASAQIINIPDANFKAKLLSANPSNQIASTETPNIPFGASAYYGGTCSSYNSIDTNNDGEIQVSEASAIKFLNIYRNVTDSIIYDCTGIGSFVNLVFFKI